MIRIGIFLHFLCGSVAVLGGMAGMSNPEGVWGLTTEMLVNGPFDNFFVPSLFLFLVLGLGNISCGLVVLRNECFSMFSFIAFGMLQVAFILVQVLLLWSFTPLHDIFLGMGFIQLAIGFSYLLQNLVKQN